MDQLAKLAGIVRNWYQTHAAAILDGCTVQVEPSAMFLQLNGNLIEYNYRVKLRSGKCESEDMVTKNLLIDHINGLTAAVKKEAQAVMFMEEIAVTWDQKSHGFRGTFLVLM